MSDLMSERYRLMIHFAVATFHFYRDDIVPIQEGEQYGVFAEKNSKVIERVCAESLNLFDYELSHEQIGTAIKAYTAHARPLTTTEPATLPERRAPHAETEFIGDKGIAQVGETPDCEDGGILRI